MNQLLAVFRCQYSSLGLLLLLLVAVAVVSTGLINSDNNVFITVDALFLMTSSHHRRQAPPTTSTSLTTTTTRASHHQRHATNKREHGRFGRITDPSPSPESNTDHRIKTTKSSQLVLNRMVVGGRREGEEGRGEGSSAKGGFSPGFYNENVDCFHKKDKDKHTIKIEIILMMLDTHLYR